jgi:hypothetical protein
MNVEPVRKTWRGSLGLLLRSIVLFAPQRLIPIVFDR